MYPWILHFSLLSLIVVSWNLMGYDLEGVFSALQFFAWWSLYPAFHYEPTTNDSILKANSLTRDTNSQKGLIPYCKTILPNVVISHRICADISMEIPMHKMSLTCVGRRERVGERESWGEGERGNWNRISKSKTYSFICVRRFILF